MIIEKTFINKFDTKDTTLIHARDPVAAKLEWLRKKFNKHCLKNCYIVDVIRLNRHTPFTNEWNRSGGAWYTNVDFTVSAIVYDQHEIIVDATIVNTLENKFILVSEHASIGVMSHKDLQTFKVGQKMPVRVSMANYSAYDTRVSCSATLMSPILGPHMQSIAIEISEDDHTALKPLYNTVENLQKTVGELSKDDSVKYNTFKDILYPYTSRPKDTKTVPIRDITTATVSRPDWVDMDQMVCVAEAASDKKVENGINVLRDYLNTIIKNITILLDLVRVYEINESTKHIWELYIKNRIQIPEVRSRRQSPSQSPRKTSQSPEQKSPSPKSPSKSIVKSPAKAKPKK
jgi:hypothetical protein